MKIRDNLGRNLQNLGSLFLFGDDDTVFSIEDKTEEEKETSIRVEFDLTMLGKKVGEMRILHGEKWKNVRVPFLKIDKGESQKQYRMIVEKVLGRRKNIEQQGQVFEPKKGRINPTL